MKLLKQLLHFVLRLINKNGPTFMIENFIDSALIIDDKKDEVEKLISLLTGKDIWVKYYHPNDIQETKFKTRKIIFLDLLLDDSKSEKDNISTIIRPMFTKNFGKEYGTYGIVLWTRHLEWVAEFQKRIQNDFEKYSLPLFIVGLDKTKYLKSGNFDSIFSDLNKILSENIAASFFIVWNTLVNEGKDRAIRNIYSLVKDYDKQNNNLQYLLFYMAKNYTGIPINDIEEYSLYLDAYRTFNDMVTYEVISQKNNSSEIFKNINNIRFIADNREYSKTISEKYLFDNNEIDLKATKNLHDKNIGKLNNEIYLTFSQLNSILLFDDANISQNKVLPGNIYEIVDKRNTLIPENLPPDAKPIIIEISPPCDYTQERMKNSKVLGGFISKYSGKKYNDYSKEYYYKEAWPIFIKDFDNPSMIIFDHRYFGSITEEELKDNKKYKLLFRAKNKLFADILQKLTSYNARLGLSIIR